MVPRIDTAPLIRTALDALETQTGLQATIEFRPVGFADAEVTIHRHERTWRFTVQVKPWLNKATLGLLREMTRARGGEWLLVTRHVTMDQAEELQAMNLCFLDTAGNCFLKQEDLYIFIKGHTAKPDGETRMGDIFRPAELKVLFALLCQEGLVAKTHVHIKEMTGVGLGTINRLLHAPEMAKYLLKLKGRNRRLVKKKELLQQWVVAYPQRLRPKLIMGRFKAPREQWWTDIDPVAFGAQWGGEVAANHLTQYLKPQTATLYAAKQPDDLIIRQKLRKDRQGEVEILKRFWNFPNVEGRADVVPPLLVYADLLATRDERIIETGRMIYEEYLAGLVREG